MKVNAPTMAYKTFYGDEPSPPIKGRECSHPHRSYRGISIDIHIPVQALDRLNTIDDIEIRSSCEGENERHLTYVIFRLKDKNVLKSSKVSGCLHKPNNNTSSSFDIGDGGQPRICISTDLWYKKSPREFERWWLTLAEKIRKCL